MGDEAAVVADDIVQAPVNVAARCQPTGQASAPRVALEAVTLLAEQLGAEHRGVVAGCAQVELGLT